jgi:hypothetical protein
MAGPHVLLVAFGQDPARTGTPGLDPLADWPPAPEPGEPGPVIRPDRRTAGVAA